MFTLFIITEMQIKTIRKYNYIYIRMAKIKRVKVADQKAGGPQSPEEKFKIQLEID